MRRGNQIPTKSSDNRPGSTYNSHLKSMTLCFADRPEKVEYTGDLARSTIEATDGSDGTNLLGRKSAA